LISFLGSLGASFITGCANGVDRSFRLALSKSDYRDKSFIACAFNSKLQYCYDLPAKKVVKDGFLPKIALAQRTIWMTKNSHLMILFPSDPIGRESARTRVTSRLPLG
jgi:hypothetical protein